MDNKILLFLLLTFFNSNAQEKVEILVSNRNYISGIANVGDTINISINNDYIKEYSKTIVEKDNGKFRIDYEKKLDDNIKFITLWSTKNNSLLKYQVINVINEEEAYELLSNINLQDYTSKKITQKNLSSLSNHKVSIISTNFSIPVARLNFTKNTTEKLGDVSLFNSLGAGVGYCWGTLTNTYDENKKIANQDFKNTFGLHLGILFSVDNGEDKRNIFAPVFNISILDFQLGYGYELGTINTNHTRSFITLSYAIPLHKLSKTGFWVHKASKSYWNQIENNS